MYPITNNFQKHTKNHMVIQQLVLKLLGLPYQHYLQGHTDHRNYIISGHLFTWLFPKYIYDKKKKFEYFKIIYPFIKPQNILSTYPYTLSTY